MKLNFKTIILLSITYILASCQTNKITINNFWDKLTKEDFVGQKAINSAEKINLKIEIKEVSYLPFINQNLPKNITLAVSSHPSVLAKIKEISAAEDLVRAKRATKGLQASAQISAGVVSEEESTDPVAIASLSVNKLLYDFGSADASIRSNIEDVKVAELAALMEGEKIALEAVDAWIELNKTEAIQKVYTDGLELVEPILGQIENISTSGLVDKANLLEAKKKYVTLKTASASAEIKTIASRKRFQNLFLVKDTFEVSRPEPLELRTSTPENLARLENSPLIKTYDHSIFSRAEQLKSLELSQKPTILANGSVIAPAKDTLQDGVANFGLVLNHTFNDGGMKDASISAAKAEVHVLKEMRQATLNLLETEFYEQTLLLEAARLEKKSFQDLFDLSVEVRDAARGQLVSGGSSIEDVLEAEVGLAEIKIRLISTNALISSASFRIYALTNGLTELFGWSIK
jgi:outer membrane protein TolC